MHLSDDSETTAKRPIPVRSQLNSTQARHGKWWPGSFVHHDDSNGCKMCGIAKGNTLAKFSVSPQRVSQRQTSRRWTLIEEEVEEMFGVRGFLVQAKT